MVFIKSNKKVVFILSTVAFLTACTNDTKINKTGTGVIGGAVAGAALGGLIGDGSAEGVVLGAMAGGLLGGAIGNALDQRDLEEQEKARMKALEHSKTGHAVKWNNPDTQVSGYIIPKSTYQNKTGEYCREYTQTVKIGGKTHEAYGTACRKPDGAWEIVS